MCEWKGDLVISYSWGNQRGKEFLALAKVRNATEREFCESFFAPPADGWRLSLRPRLLRRDCNHC